MRPTTPDFIPERLCEVREMRGLNQTALAEMIGMTRQAISQYERGQSNPSPAALTNLAKTLRVPEHRFTRPTPTKSGATGFFRSLSTATKCARVRAERRYACLRDDICGYLQSYVEFPGVRFPEFSKLPPESRANEDIELVAIETRRTFQLGDGPISDVVLLLENHGAIVARHELGARSLDAYSQLHSENGRPYIILGTERASAVRSRFDAAHELAHIVMHSHLTKREVNNPVRYKLIEQQAHYFAGAFLLPAKEFAREFRTPSLDALVTLKSRWKVSVQAMINRAHQLHLVNDYRRQRLFANLSRRWGKKSEPLDNEIQLESTRFIRRSFDLLLDNGIATRNSVEMATDLFVEDVESIAGLEDGFFGDDVEHYQFPSLSDNPKPIDRDTYPLFREPESN